jgi:DNA-binding beta-propeller fold protein YncE
MLAYPSGVALDSTGNLYIADTQNNRIREVSNGIIGTMAGTSGAIGFNGDGGPATSAQLGLPGGVAVDPAGDLYIADTVNKRIREVS